MDFKVGDKVKATVNGTEYVGEVWTAIPAAAGAGYFYLVRGNDWSYWFPAWQLTKVEEPPSPWLLTKEERYSVLGEVRDDASMAETLDLMSRAELRHVVEKLAEANDYDYRDCAPKWLLLKAEKWAELQKAAGLG